MLELRLNPSSRQYFHGVKTRLLALGTGADIPCRLIPHKTVVSPAFTMLGGHKESWN